MDDQPLKTMKEVVHHFSRPAHRIIHLCETGVVCPHVDAEGRGSVRRFSRDDTFRILVALELQEAGVQIPLIKPLMQSFNRLLEIREVKELRRRLSPSDLVSLIRHMGDKDRPVRGFLTPPNRVALVTPKFSLPSGPDVRVDLYRTDTDLLMRGVSIVISLTGIADYLANTIWKNCEGLDRSQPDADRRLPSKRESKK